MQNREIKREQLWEEHFHRWGYSAVFLMAVVRCERCTAKFQATSQPRATQDETVRECLAAINGAGWRVGPDDRPVCPTCLRQQSAPDPPADNL